MHRRPAILLGMAAGLLWTGVIVIILGGFTEYRFRDLHAFTGFGFAMAGPGLILSLLIGRLASRRFFDPDLIDGQPHAVGSAAEIDQRVLTNTVEQTVLAACIWAFALTCFGPEVIVAFGIGFLIARLVFWIGYHISPPLRAFGFAATFYPTVLLGAGTAVELASY